MTPSSTLLAADARNVGLLSESIRVAYCIKFAKRYTELPDSGPMSITLRYGLDIHELCENVFGLRVFASVNSVMDPC